MGRPQPVEATSADEQMLRIWEEMRIELLHELQEGADADIPDSLIDEMGNLVVILQSMKAETKLLTRLPLSA